MEVAARRVAKSTRLNESRRAVDRAKFSGAHDARLTLRGILVSRLWPRNDHGTQPCSADFQSFDGLQVDLSLRRAQLESLLEVQPKFRRGTKKLREPERSVCGDVPIAVHDRADAIGRHVQAFGEPVRAHVQWNEIFLAENLAGVNGTHAVFHDDFFQW